MRSEKMVSRFIEITEEQYQKIQKEKAKLEMDKDMEYIQYLLSYFVE